MASLMPESPRISVLSIDPGVTTGFVLANMREGTVFLNPFQLQNCAVRNLWETLVRIRPDQIICEDFEFRRHLYWAELYPVQLIGVVNLYCELDTKIKLYMQKAAQGKSFYKDKEKLKEAGVYLPGQNFHHSMDAMRHFMYWFMFGSGFKYNEGQKLHIHKQSNY